jgi:hypothetical protein
MTRVVAFVPDLMDRSRFGGGATFVTSPAELVDAEADLVIVDLSRPGVLEVLPRVAARTIGFGSHVDADLLDAARAAGCDEVLPRSQLFRRLPGLLGE